MILKLSVLLTFIFIFGFSSFGEAKGRFDDAFRDNACKEDPNSRNCQSAKAMYPAPAPQNQLPAGTRPPQYGILPAGTKNPNVGVPISQAPAAATEIMKTPAAKSPGGTSTGKSTGGAPKTNPANAFTQVPKVSPTPSPRPPAKPVDAEVGKFLNHCTENPGAPECGGSKVAPNPKYVPPPKTAVPKNGSSEEAGSTAGLPTAPVLPAKLPLAPSPSPQSSEGESFGGVQDSQSVAPVAPPAESTAPATASPPVAEQPAAQAAPAPAMQVQPQAPQPAAVQTAAECSTNFSFAFTNQADFQEWQNAKNQGDGRSVACQGIQEGGSIRVCCQSDPMVDATGKSSTPTTAAEAYGDDENSKPLTPKEREACQIAEEKVSKCMAEFPSAENNCDPEKGSFGQWSRGLQIGAGGLQAVSQSSIQAACMGVSQMAGGMNAAVTAFESLCQSSRESCISSCNQAKSSIDRCPSSYRGFQALSDAVTQLEESARKCQGYGSRVEAAKQNANGVLYAFQTSQQCAIYTKAMNQPGLCQKDPTAPGCGALAQTCDNPAFAASNTVCICVRTPGDPRCQSTAGAGSGVAGFGASKVGAANLPPGALGNMGENVGGSLAGSDAFSSLAGGGPGGPGAPGEDPGGKKNSGAALNPSTGGGNSGGGGGGNGGSGYERNSQQVYSGNWGSSGGGGGFGFRAGGGSASGGSNGYLRNPSTADINQFKPSMKMNKFSPGVMGLTGPDGLTGPNSNTIWQKVRNRYQAKIYSLKQRP